MTRLCEPPIDELLGEPAVRLLMASDGVEESQIRHLLTEIGKRRRAIVGDRQHG